MEPHFHEIESTSAYVRAYTTAPPRKEEKGQIHVSKRKQAETLSTQNEAVSSLSATVETASCHSKVPAIFGNLAKPFPREENTRWQHGICTLFL